MNRRKFLTVTASTVGALLLPLPVTSREVSVSRLIPEYSGSLAEFLFVYDQSAAPQLLREIVAIVRHAPPESVVHALVSRSHSKEARRRLQEFGLAEVRLLISDEDQVSGDWGRDIFQLGRSPDGTPTVFVPWYKSASSREDLDRGYRQLRGLARNNLNVQLLPIAAEGGNLMTDRIGDRDTLFAGSTIAVETRALYRTYYGVDPGKAGVETILRDALGVQDVIWLGPRRDGACVRQAHFLFHIDMGLSIVATGVAVVARCDPFTLHEERHRTILSQEAERSIETLSLREAQGQPWPEGLELPRDPAERSVYLEQRLEWEREALVTASEEMEDIAIRMSGLGYEVHRVNAAPERVRRYQSYTNVIPTSDRLLVPLFPSQENVHGWVLKRETGRDSIDLDLGLQDSEFDLSGDNLAALQLYQGLHPGVRAVRDYFYLASGNVHCVIGRLA